MTLVTSFYSSNVLNVPLPLKQDKRSAVLVHFGFKEQVRML